MVNVLAGPETVRAHSAPGWGEPLFRRWRCSMSLTLVIGNKNYSSWSLRAALALELTGEPYEERRIPLRQADTAQRIGEFSLSGRVPVLLTEQGPVWDSLAIAEYLAERCPEAHLWPR